MTRSRLLAFAVVLLSVPLGGCPLDLPAPLGEPGPGSLDPALEGRWGWTDPKRNEEGEFSFSRFNATEYVAVGKEKGKEPLFVFRVFTTKAGSAAYLNVCELKPGKEPSFLFARYTVKGDELSMRLVDENEVPKEIQGDPKALARFLATHPEVPAASGDPMLLRRLPRVPPKAEATAAPKAG
jgi:hypothetical protein